MPLSLTSPVHVQRDCSFIPQVNYEFCNKKHTRQLSDLIFILFSGIFLVNKFPFFPARSQLRQSLLLGSGSSLQLLFADAILLEGAHESALVARRLEATMSKLRAGVDELEVDGFEGRALGVHQERLSQGDDALLGSDAAALDHQEVVVDLSVVGEAAHWSDGLVGDVVLGRGVVLDDLLVEMVGKLV